MGWAPRLSPATRPNLTMCGTRFATGGVAVRAALIDSGRIAETTATDEKNLPNM